MQEFYDENGKPLQRIGERQVFYDENGKVIKRFGEKVYYDAGGRPVMIWRVRWSTVWEIVALIAVAGVAVWSFAWGPLS